MKETIVIIGNSPTQLALVWTALKDNKIGFNKRTDLGKIGVFFEVLSEFQQPCLRILEGEVQGCGELLDSYDAKPEYKDLPRIDATQDLAALLEYLKEPVTPKIYINGYEVEFQKDGIKVGCWDVSKEKVKAIYDHMFPQEANPFTDTESTELFEIARIALYEHLITTAERLDLQESYLVGLRDKLESCMKEEKQ